MPNQMQEKAAARGLPRRPLPVIYITRVRTLLPVNRPRLQYTSREQHDGRSEQNGRAWSLQRGTTTWPAKARPAVPVEADVNLRTSVITAEPFAPEKAPVPPVMVAS